MKHGIQKRIAFCCIIAACFANTCYGAETSPTDAALELRAAIDVLKTHHINREHVDWSAIEAHAYSMIDSKTLALDAYPAIEYAVHQMGEQHTFLRPARIVELLRTGKPSDDGRPVGETTLPLAGRYPDDIIAINVPGHTGSIDSDRSYAMTLRRVLSYAQKIGICRILIDLRSNDGGNMWPMLNGLAPLLGQEPYGYFLNTDGTETPWNVSNGTTTVTDGVEPPDPQTTEALRAFPVAVLIGSGTLSSGEFTAMAFRGRPNTIFFGAQTGGFVTANGTYQLPDGAQLFVAQSWASDRLHKPYRIAIAPDKNTDGRETLDVGLTWLKQQKCTHETP